MVTYKQLLKEQTEGLVKAGNDNAVFDGAELLGLALGVDCRSGAFEALTEKPAEESVKAEFEALCERRKKGEPLQYILGEWEFYGLTVKVGKGVLIPRQDTETLVELIVDKYKNSDNLVVTDLCAGSGCIALALEKYLGCREVYAVEKSEAAAKYLAENIKLNGSAVKLVMGDVLKEETAESLPVADIITCNPPYLTSADMAALQTEVTHEPAEALFGGEDGLDLYRAVTRIWKDRLVSGGTLIYEIGAGQEDDVMQIMVQHGFENVRCRPDPCGMMRCVMGTKK
ncbi:peptide chain release factor N(5)-glutamine methyltransferase [Ruminococcus sp.]|uniref:peptide chain release factor N(5)-glutamine methyltransferase n=1 Tax=Ruminococcus sp. TaxID=41978 RepID=UPI0025CDD320|nr:peptide chain release factor N(5)-glutamine methyltransferase [Ruminococcus sp.]MBQ8967768.1 peptide chain release factor N(5)-glutamine methyltransferase [Ruminococcus sp.]